jgi:hypothetical protein
MITESKLCYESAKSEGREIGYKPERLIIRLDEQLKDSDQWLGLRLQSKKTAPSITVETVDRLPVYFDPKWAYVDISPIFYEIDHGSHRYIRGLQTNILDGSGQIIATQLDYKRSWGWCLGEPQPIAVEKFLGSKLQVPIGFSELNYPDDYINTIRSPKGTVTKVVSGKFFESIRPSFAGEAMEMRNIFEALPTKESCIFERVDSYWAVCHQNDVSKKTRIYLRDLSYIHRASDTWFAFFNNRQTPSLIDSLKVIQYHQDGSKINEWLVRLPATDTSDNFVVRNAVVNESKFTVDIAYSRKVEGVPSTAIPTPVKEWYEKKFSASFMLGQK